MKKLYYPLIAISMTIISFILTPIKSYAAGTNHSLTFNFDTDNLRLAVTYNSDARSSSFNMDTGESCVIDYTINLRMLVPNGVGSQRPYYASGYAMGFVQIPMTFNAGINSSVWSYSYDVTYNDTSDGVVQCIPIVRMQNTNLQIYYYAYFDDFYMPVQSSLACEAVLNVHINTVVADTNVVPGITLGQGTFTNNGYQMTLNTNPDTSVGLARIISLAVEHAIHNSVDIDLIYSMISDIYSVDSTYLPSILSALQTNNYDLDLIYGRLIIQYGMDYQFQQEVLRYLQQYGMTKASEAASEATEVQEEMSEVAESLEIPEPSIDGVYDDIDEMLNASDQHQLFFWLQGNGNILVSILIFTFAIAMAGYVLYGRM